MADTEVAAKPRKTKRTKPKAAKQDEEQIPLADMENGTSKFDMLLKQAVDQATDNAKSKKKKKKKETSDAVLESLRKGEGLQKEEDDAIKANTYDPDNSPKNEKSNKRRQKLRELGKDNVSFEDETVKTTKKKKKKPKADETEETELKGETPVITEMDPTDSVEKKKKKKKKPPDDDAEPPPAEEQEATPAKVGKKKKKKTTEEDEAPIVPQSPEPTSPKANNLKKKKKVVMEETEEERQSAMSPVMSEEEQPSTPSKEKKKKKKKVRTEDEEEDQKSEDVISKEGEDEEETDVKQTPKKKGKKKKQKDDIALTQEEEERKKQREAIEDEGQILSVMIHRTDKLKNDFNIMHPLIRVHIIDEDTGNHLQKQRKDRAVSAYFETQNENISHIVPIMTQPFDFKQRKSVLPVWEELILFNENYDYLIQEYPKVIVFFELLDFVSMNTASRQYASGGSEGGWHRIAWAFLKVVGVNNKLNVGSKVRLQLFEVPYGLKTKAGQAEIFQWWKSQPRRPYPSTLYVTLKGITPPDEVEPAMRSMFATQQEVGRNTYADLKKSINWSDQRRMREDTKKTLSSWTRLAGQMCRIPNRHALTLPAGRKGCYALKFSHDGRNLACACSDRDNHPILVYEIPSGNLLGTFKGHFGLVYDLCWSKRDTHLLSASSDGTVRVWKIDNFEFSHKLLPHPGYVYTAQFHPRVDTVVVTGGFDQVVRVWDIDVDSPHGQLKQELEDHSGHVNSLCFDDDGQKLYSGDSVGSIFVWNVHVSEKATQRGFDSSSDEEEDTGKPSGRMSPVRVGFLRDWTLFHKMEDPELKDTCINHLQLHHSGRRLLVHTRDNIIRMFDLRIQRIMQKYIGALNFREQIRSTITPCGSFVFAGSEDNFAYAWNTDTGDQIAMYSQLNYRHPVTDIDYHPRDHMFAACSLGDNQPIIVYDYDAQVAQMDAGLTPRTIVPESTADLEATAMGTTQADTLTSSKVLTKDEFQAHSTARLEKVMRKLNTATNQMMATPNMDLPGVPSTSPQLAHTGFMSMDSMTPRTMMTSPQMFSPHAPRTMTGIMQQQQFASQKLYLRTSDSDWRPGFSDVGRSGARSSSPTFVGRPPQIALTTGLGKAQFTFQAPPGKAATSYRQVIALYDYRAQRSDELTIFKGDVISVLYKDSENWWMGELPDGQQGFFPANYVAEEDGMPRDSGRGVDDDDELSPISSPSKSKKVTAVTTKSGELKFLSGAEDSEDEILASKPKKNNKKKKRGSQGSILSDAGSTGSKGSKTAKPPVVPPNESNA